MRRTKPAKTSEDSPDCCVYTIVKIHQQKKLEPLRRTKNPFTRLTFAALFKHSTTIELGDCETLDCGAVWKGNDLEKLTKRAGKPRKMVKVEVQKSSLESAQLSRNPQGTDYK